VLLKIIVSMCPAMISEVKFQY